MLILAYRILPEQLCLILCEFSVTIPDFPLCIDPGRATLRSKYSVKKEYVTIDV